MGEVATEAVVVEVLVDLLNLKVMLGLKRFHRPFITSGNTVKFDFPQKATPVLYLSFDSQKTAGKTTTIVEMLKGKSTLVTGLPSGEVYKYLNIWVGNGGFGDSNNIANAVINFKVEKNWIKDKSIGQSSITLNRYSDKKWNQLSTNLSGEDDKYLYFTAKTSGFSSFAITGNSTAKENKDGIKSENNESVASDITQQPLNQANDSTSEKKSMSTPGFDIVYAVICLFGVLLYRR